MMRSIMQRQASKTLCFTPLRSTFPSSFMWAQPSLRKAFGSRIMLKSVPTFRAVSSLASPAASTRFSSLPSLAVLPSFAAAARHSTPSGHVKLASFHSSSVTREWHEKKDAEGKTYYYQIYTKEKTYEQPDMWLPLDKQDSPAMRFFRSDSFAERGDKISNTYWAVFALIIIGLACYDYVTSQNDANDERELEALKGKTGETNGRVVRRVIRKKKSSDEDI